MTKKRRQIYISVTPQVDSYLRRLLAAGLYGTTLSNVAERLICRQIHEMQLKSADPRPLFVKREVS